MDVPTEFYTPQSILTLTGATGAVYVISAGLQHAFNFNPRWFALAISLVLAVAGAYATQPPVVGSYLIAIVNGFLIYCTAVGVNSVTAKPGDSAAVSKGVLRGGKSTSSRRNFRSSWY